MGKLFTPLSSSFLGFDSLFNDIERLLDTVNSQAIHGGHPPINVFKEQGDDYTIQLALAGFKREQITITHNEQTGELVIKGTSGLPDVDAAAPLAPETPVPAQQRVALKRGIANRSFTRTFTLHRDIVVKWADMEDGMLTVVIGKKPQEQSPVRTIALGQPESSDFKQLSSSV